MWSAKAKLKKDTPFGDNILKKGTRVNITKGREYEYAIWGVDDGIIDKWDKIPKKFIWDVPKEYINEKSIKPR